MARSHLGNTPCTLQRIGPTMSPSFKRCWTQVPTVRAENEDGNRPADLAWDIRGSEAYWRLVVPVGVLAPARTFNAASTRPTRFGTTVRTNDVWTVTARAGQRAVIDMDSDDVDAYLRVLRNDGTRIGIERARGVPGDPRRRLPRHRHELRVGRDGGGIG